jgi:hypothetical protein
MNCLIQSVIITGIFGDSVLRCESTTTGKEGVDGKSEKEEVLGAGRMTERPGRLQRYEWMWPGVLRGV